MGNGLLAWIATLLLPSIALGQETREVTMEMITLKMPVEMSMLLQGRIDQGGQESSTAINRLPELVKTQKLEEIDRWHQVMADGKMEEHTIPGGKDLKLKTGEPVPLGTKIKFEPTLGGNGVIHARFSLDVDSSIAGDHSRYASRQISTSMAVKADEWNTWGSWRDGEQVVLIVGKFSGPDTGWKDDQAGMIRQASLIYSLCLLDPAILPKGSSERISGAAALILLKKAKVIDAGSFMLRQRDQSGVNAFICPLDMDAGEGLTEFALQTSICFSADQKLAETGLILSHTSKRGQNNSITYNRWVQLPVGTTTLLKLNEDSKGNQGKLFLALEPRSKEISPAGESAGEHRVSPSATRLLAEAAGLPVLQPETNKGFFATLPKVSESLEKLGMEIPPGVEVIENPNGPTIWMSGENAPNTRLKEILAKYLPPATDNPEIPAAK